MTRWLDLLIPGLLLVLAIAVRADEPAAVTQMRNLVFDEYQRLQPRPYAPQPVKIVDIDEESLRRLGQWPWPRHLLADIVDRLRAHGAAVVAFDVIFAEPDRSAPRNFLALWPQAANDPELRSELMRLPDPDEALAAALSRVGSVTAFALLGAGEASRRASVPPPRPEAGFAENGDRAAPFVGQYAAAVRSLPGLEAAASGNGFVNTEPDQDGVVRHVPLVLGVGEQLFPAFAAEALRVAQGAGSYVVRASGASRTRSFGSSTGIDSVKIGAAIVPTDGQGRLLLYDSGHVAARFVPIWEVMEPGFDAGRIAGQIAPIGTTVQGLLDLRSTPLEAAMPGVEIHAQMLEQMMARHFLARPDWADGAEIVYLAVFGLVLIVALRRAGALPTLAIALVASGGALAASWAAFSRAGWLIDPLFPCFVVLLIYMSGSLLGYLRTENEKRRVRSIFGRYLSPVVVDRLTRSEAPVSLGGEIRELTLMFSDIKGFTQIAEKLDPQALTQLVNRFLTPMTTVIQDRGGTIDKYIGDCIMAFWNAPLDDPDHAARALGAALAMRDALARLNAALREEAAAGAVPVQIAAGIGLNTGPGCVGNFGSEQRLEYSVIGDSVNLAARIEGLTRIYGVDIVLGEATAAGAPGFALLEIDQARVKGHAAPLRIFTALGGAERRADPGFARLAESHAALIACYRRQDWDGADAALSRARAQAVSIGGDVTLVKLYTLYARRIAEYRAAPPPRDWDGVHVARGASG